MYLFLSYFIWESPKIFSINSIHSNPKLHVYNYYITFPILRNYIPPNNLSIIFQAAQIKIFKKMAFSKLVLLCLFALVATVISLPNDLMIGTRIRGDELVQKEVIEKSYSLFGSVEIDKTFNGYSKITMIRAIDRSTNGHGAKVTVIAGGVGQAFVTLHFQSESVRGIDFEVEIYAIR